MTQQADSDPSSLLTTALEKLLYLESRLDTAEAARDEAARESDRHRLSAHAARQALSDWQRRTTDAEVAAEGAEREVAVLRGALAETRQAMNASPRELELSAALRSAEEQLVRFERERGIWLDRMATIQQLGGTGADELDLGAFISELRAELLALRRGDTDRVRATVGDRPAAPDPKAILAEAPAGQIDAETLIRNAHLPRPDRTLASLCARDLLSDSAAVRRRAAERLLESGIDALGPLAASLLGTEPEATVRVASVRLIARSPGEWTTLALRRTLGDGAAGDSDPRVRTAALDGLARRPGTDFAAALRDPSPAVRRRALALLPKSDGASVERLAFALCDDDASVRKLAVLALAAHAGAEVNAVLDAATRSADSEVREAALRALERRRLPVPKAAAKAASIDQATIESALLAEIRTALRGRTEEELAEALAADPGAVQAIVERLLAAGGLVRRGPKLYLP